MLINVYTLQQFTLKISKNKSDQVQDEVTHRGTLHVKMSCLVTIKLFVRRFKIVSVRLIT